MKYAPNAHRFGRGRVLGEPHAERDLRMAAVGCNHDPGMKVVVGRRWRPRARR